MQAYRKQFLVIFGLSALLRLGCAFSNLGYLAFDDYVHGSALVIPAQRHVDLGEIVAKAGFRSPVPSVVWYGLAQASLKLGLESPVDQYRFHYAVLGLWSLLAVWLVWKIFQELGRPREGLFAAALTGCQFMMPFLGTRTLIESMSAPLLTAAIYFLLRFWNRSEGRPWNAAFAFLFLALSCQFRFHNGLCVPVFLVALAWRRDARSWATAALAGLAGFVLIGWIDLILRGEFHASLLEYLRYHRTLIETHKEGTPVTHIGFFIGMTLPPAFFSRYRGLKWGETYRKLLPAVWALGIFVVAHSLVPIRHERFMAPALPLFFLLLAPLAVWLWDRGRPWRRYYFVGLNTVLVVLVTFPTNQWNVIGSAIWIDGHPTVTSIVAYHDSIEIWPGALVRRPFPERQIVNLEQLQAMRGCGPVVAVREDRLEETAATLAKWQEVSVAKPSLTESLMIITNPRRNLRRKPVHLFVPENCAV